MKEQIDTANIRSMLELVYSAGESMEEKGLHIPLADEVGGFPRAVKMDVIVCVMKISEKDRRITQECIDYLSELLEMDITAANIKKARIYMEEPEQPLVSSLLPFMIVIDHGFGSANLCNAYIRALAFSALMYLQHQDDTSYVEVMNYYRYFTECITLVENTTGAEVDFNPIEVFDSRTQELIREYDMATRQAKMFKRAELISTIEDGMIRMFAEESNDSDEPEESEAPDQSGMEELQNMVGLERVKALIGTIVNLDAIRKMCKSYDISRPAISMHMVFSGNPGTGKTTVARLLGKIYREEGLLPKGHFVEVTRADLVGKYVGHTAALVKEAFEKAKGGVLFIDEAYSLTEGDDSFGEEAVSTMVKLMEDYRDEIAVIVAGYPQKMQEFLDSNPGLNSRFPFVVDFPDYSPFELLQIFCKLCAEYGIIPDRKIINAVRTHFEKEYSWRTGKRGNARDVRNFFEKMLINQANRLINNKPVSKEDICRFTMEDLPEKKIISDIRRKPSIKSGKVVSIKGRD